MHTRHAVFGSRTKMRTSSITVVYPERALWSDRLARCATCRSTPARGRTTKDRIRSTTRRLCNSAPSHSLLGLLTHYSITIIELHKTEGLPLNLIIIVCISLYLMGKNTGVTLGWGAGDKCPFNILTTEEYSFCS
jgi:hypothetical protein